MRLVPAHKEPVVHVESRVVSNARTLAQLEKYKNRPADLDSDFSATPSAETIEELLFKRYKTLDELG